MIKNLALALSLAVVGCDATASTTDQPEALQGVVEHEERVLPFELGGRVVSLSVTEGDAVVAGRELARLDDKLARLAVDARNAELQAVRADLDLLQAGSRPEDIRALKAEVAAAKASEGLAERNLARLQSLTGRGITSTADLDSARTAWEQASAQRRDLQARLARLHHGARAEEIAAAQARVAAVEVAVSTAREQAERHVLYADAPGTVLQVHVELHELAAVGTPVVTLVDVQRPYVDVFVPEARIGEAQLGGAATISVDGESAPFSGVVEHISSRTEFTPKFLFSERERPNLVIRVRVRIDDPEARLRAGVPAFVEFQATEHAS